MRPVILYRGREFVEYELQAAQAAGFFCTDSRMDIKPNDLVVGRYSVLPYYREQERDLHKISARLFNTYAQHCFLADIGEWYQDFKDITPETWNFNDYFPDDEQGPFFLKGQTNSKKFLFDTHCLAKTRGDVRAVLSRLLDDSLISEQKIYIRKFENLVTYGYGLHGMPITKEYRLFYACGKLISMGYYWASHVEDLEHFGVDKNLVLDTSTIPESFLNTILEKIQSIDINGVVVDVAQKTDGSWMVVELNDLQMSGLSCNDPHFMYANLYSAIASRQESYFI